MAPRQATRLNQTLRRVVADLADAQVSWALIGGIAVGARSDPRFTRDLDLAIAVESDDEAERVVHTMVMSGYQVRAAIEQVRAGRLATARLTPASVALREVYVDLLFASSGIESEIVAAADTIEILPGVRGPVARTGHLIALKILSESATRPQDLADLRALGAVATRADWTLARAALVLIRKRGYHRGKPLLRLLGVHQRATRRS